MSAFEISRAVVVTAEVMGHEISVAAAEAMARELVRYDLATVATALKRCQRELTGRLSLARVLERLPGRHLGADEAWAMCPRSEAQSVVWTDQAAVAFAAAKPLLDEGDAVAARMAFREAYQRELALTEGAPPKWFPSLGHDVSGRVDVVRQAVRLGRLSPGAADNLVGHLLPGNERLALASGTATLAETLRSLESCPPNSKH